MWRTTTKLRRITGLVRTRGGRGGSRTFEGIRGLEEGGFLWEGAPPSLDVFDLPLAQLAALDFGGE